MKQIISIRKAFLSLICLVFVVWGLNAQPQPIKLDYDASGNTVGRGFDAVSTSSDELDVAEPEEQSCVKIFPNPTAGLVKVEIDASGNVLRGGTLAVYSVNGRMILKLNTLQPLNSIDLTEQPAGIYLLQIVIDGKTETHRVVKE